MFSSSLVVFLHYCFDLICEKIDICQVPNVKNLVKPSSSQPPIEQNDSLVYHANCASQFGKISGAVTSNVHRLPYAPNTPFKFASLGT
jgi:hypothetical protein